MRWKSFLKISLLILLDLTLILSTIVPLFFSIFKPLLPLNKTSTISNYFQIIDTIKVISCPYPLVIYQGLCRLPDYSALPEWRISALLTAIVFVLFNLFVLLVWFTHRSLCKGIFLCLIVLLFLSLLLGVIFILSAIHLIDDLSPGKNLYEQIIGFILHFEILSFFLWLNMHLFQVIYVLLFPTLNSPINTTRAVIFKIILLTLSALFIPSVNIIFLHGYSVLTFLPLPTTWNGFFYLLVLPLCLLNTTVLIMATLLVIVVSNIKRAAGDVNRIFYLSLTSYIVRMFFFFAVASITLDLLLSMSLIVKNHELLFNKPNETFYLAISIAYNSNMSSPDPVMNYHTHTTIKILNLSFIPLVLWPVCFLCYELAFSWITINKLLSKWSVQVRRCCHFAFTSLKSSEQQEIPTSSN